MMVQGAQPSWRRPYSWSATSDGILAATHQYWVCAHDQSRCFHLRRAGLLGSLPATRAFRPTRSERPLPCCDGCSFSPLPGRFVAKAAVDRQRPLIPYNSPSPDLERVRSVDRGQLPILLSRHTERGTAFAAGGGEVTLV